MDGRRRALLSVPFGYASLHCEQGTPIPLANDLQLFNFRWQSLFKFGWQWTFEPASAEFNGMFTPKDDYYYWISKVIQKSRISVSEWGTEAGSVTVVEMDGATDAGPGPKEVFFYADHPFVFIIGEETSGTILFEGVVMQP